MNLKVYYKYGGVFRQKDGTYAVCIEDKGDKVKIVGMELTFFKAMAKYKECLDNPKDCKWN